MDVSEPPSERIRFELFTSAFCGACQATRNVLGEVTRLVPDSEVIEHDVASEPDYSEAHNIDFTPTIVVRGLGGTEVFRASGVPTVNQVLAAAALALEA
jgi:thioredoxin 1